MKRINVSEVVQRFNTQIAQTNNVTVKESLCDMIADILHDCKEYKGFMYTFWTSEVMDHYQSVDDAINAGCGTEFDRYYF